MAVVLSCDSATIIYGWFTQSAVTLITPAGLTALQAGGRLDAVQQQVLSTEPTRAARPRDA